MNLLLTSDFPSTMTEAVVQRVRAAGSSPRVAWIGPFTATGRARFPEAQAVFGSLGIPDLEYCDIDEAPDDDRLKGLAQYDVVYLSGGDPIGFRRNLVRSGAFDRVRTFLGGSGLVVAASGGAMQFTPNVSLFRLLSTTVDVVLAERDAYGAMGAVPYEILPHLNRHDVSFLDKVQYLSEQVPHDIVALADGAAMMHVGESIRCVGHAVRFSGGIRTAIDTAG